MMMAPQIRLTDDPSDGSVSGDAATRLILVLVQRIPPADPLQLVHVSCFHEPRKRQPFLAGNQPLSLIRVDLINGVCLLVSGVGGWGGTSERLLCFGCGIYDDWIQTELQLCERRLSTLDCSTN